MSGRAHCYASANYFVRSRFSGAVVDGWREGSAAGAASRSTEVQRQGDRFIAKCRMKNKQDRDAMFTILGSTAHAGIAFDDKTIVRKRTQIVETMEVRCYLPLDALRQRSVPGFEHRSFCSRSNRIDDLQTESPHGQFCEPAMCFATSTHR